MIHQGIVHMWSTKSKLDEICTKNDPGGDYRQPRKPNGEIGENVEGELIVTVRTGALCWSPQV